MSADPIRGLSQMPDDEEADSSNRAEFIEMLVRSTGRTFVVLNNAWFANEKFHFWETYLFADIDRVSEKAILFERVVPAKRAIGEWRRFFREIEREPELMDAEMAQGIFSGAKSAAQGSPSDRSTKGWLPKSQIEMMITHEGPDDHLVFRPGVDEPEPGSASSADVQISERIMVSGRYKQYRKLAVDSPFEAKDVLDEMEWDEFHASPKYKGEEFICWTVDEKPVEVARKFTEAGFSVAVSEHLIG